MATVTMVSQFQSSTVAFRIFEKQIELQTGPNATGPNATRISLCSAQQDVCGRLTNICSSSRRSLKCLKPISAAGSGVEVSTDPKDNAIRIFNAKIVVESEDIDKMQLRVDLNGNETQKVYALVLRNLSLSAPPLPGLRKQKGGKTAKIPEKFLLDLFGKDKVTEFVINEMVTSTLSNYVKKENLKVKDTKVKTVQTSEELKSLFAPGKEFGFNVTLELELF